MKKIKSQTNKSQQLRGGDETQLEVELHKATEVFTEHAAPMSAFTRNKTELASDLRREAKWTACHKIKIHLGEGRRRTKLPARKIFTLLIM